jgi:hypothetical protein
VEDKKARRLTVLNMRSFSALRCVCLLFSVVNQFKMDKDHFFVYNGKRNSFLNDVDCNCAHNVVICGINEVAVSAEGGTVEIIDWRSSASVCSLKGHNGNVSEHKCLHC